MDFIKEKTNISSGQRSAHTGYHLLVTYCACGGRQ